MKNEQDLRVIVLAAGKGKRLQSEADNLPKVLRQACGRPLLSWVLDNLAFVPPSRITVVVGFMAEMVREAMGRQYKYVVQKEQLGTGHAVAVAAGSFRGYTGSVLVVYGDMPLYQPETYRNLFDRHTKSKAACTLLTARSSEIQDYGRIIRDPDGRFSRIVEKKDCTPEQALIDEVNPGVYVYQSAILFKTLKKLSNKNAQGEYYLTDVPQLIREEGLPVETLTIEDDRQILGVNTLEDLAVCEAILSEKH